MRMTHFSLAQTAHEYLGNLSHDSVLLNVLALRKPTTIRGERYECSGSERRVRESWRASQTEALPLTP
jgi:hypothetical protein